MMVRDETAKTPGETGVRSHERLKSKPARWHTAQPHASLSQRRIGAPVAPLLQWAKAAEAFMNNVG
jgi:hypothetical protein